MIVYEKPAEYRGTIEVYVEDCQVPSCGNCPEWRWRCKSRNGANLGGGGGYKRRAGALNAIDAQYSARLSRRAQRYLATGGDPVVPWRLVIHDRHGNIEHIWAVY